MPKQTPTAREALAEQIEEYGRMMFDAGMDANSDFADRRRDGVRKETDAKELLAGVLAALTESQPAPEAKAGTGGEHRPGCEALGGYGHGVGPCDCGATQPAPAERQASVPEVKLEYCASCRAVRTTRCTGPCDECGCVEFDPSQGAAPDGEKT